MKNIIRVSLFALSLLWGATLSAQEIDPEQPPDMTKPAQGTTPTEPAPAEPAPAEAAPTPENTPAPAESTPPVASETTPAEPEASVSNVAAPTVLLGLGAGVYIPTSGLAVNFLVGLDVSYQLPFLGGKLGVGAGFAFSQPTTSGTLEDGRVPGGQADYDSTMRELMVDLLLSYRILGWDSVWSPHVAVGPLVYMLSHKVSSLGVENTETSTQFGFLAAAGVDYALWRGALVGEVRFPFGTVGQRTTGDSNVGAVSVVVGYRLRF